MCDYSLQGLPNRLAVQGEHLITFRFRTGSIGLAAPAQIAAPATLKPGSRGGWWARVMRYLAGPLPEDDACAVCIPPGAQLLMTQIPERMRKTGLKAEENVTFVQLSAESFQYRDAIRFANGRELVLQSIPVNVMFQVLSTGPCEPAESGLTDWTSLPWSTQDLPKY